MLHIGYKKKYIVETVNTNFLGLQIYHQPKWKNHVEQMFPKLSGACLAIRLMVHINNIDHLKSISVQTFILL